MRQFHMGDFGSAVVSKAQNRIKPAIPQRSAGFLQNVAARVKDDATQFYSKVDTKLNKMLFPKGDYNKVVAPAIKPAIKPVAVQAPVKQTVIQNQTVKMAPTQQQLIKQTPAQSTQLVVTNSSLPSASPASMSPVAMAGIAAAILGAGYLFLKD